MFNYYIIKLILVIQTFLIAIAFLSYTVGVAYDTIQRDLSDEVKKSGLHNGPPGFKFIKFPSVFKSKTFTNVKCLNKEGLEIVLNVEFQYRARPKDLRKIIVQFKDFENYGKVLRYVWSKYII